MMNLAPSDAWMIILLLLIIVASHIQLIKLPYFPFDYVFWEMSSWPYTYIPLLQVLECMKKFCLAITQVFEDEYLRNPNQADVDRLLQVAEAHDFLGMLGCIDCMH